MSEFGTNSARYRLASAVYDCLSEESKDHLVYLCGVAEALHLKDVSRPSMVLAAIEALIAAEDTQAAEERVYDLIQSLQEQTTTLSELLKTFESTLENLDRTSAREAVEMETHRRKGTEEMAKVEKYKLQQEQNAARLQAAGFHPKIAHSHLQSLRQQQKQQEAELAATTASLKQFAGLPADMGAARAALLERLEELQRQKEQLAEGLAGL